MHDWHATTILSVRRGGRVAVGGDGQVTLGTTVMKGDAVKVRKLLDGQVLVGFAGSAADGFALLERFEAKLRDPPDPLLPGAPAPADLTPTKPAPFVPRFPVRDPADPLDPGKLASADLTANQALGQANRVIRTVRPAFYGEYPALIEQVRGLADQYANFLAWAEFDYSRAELYLKDLQAAGLKGVDGLKAMDDARKGLGDAWLTWRSVYATARDLAGAYATLSRKKAPPFPAGSQPPATPPSLG